MNMGNIKLAFRTLFRTPFVTTVAVLSLALGIGANAAIFSLADQVLFKPLPVPEPERLVNIAAPGPNPGYQSCNQAGDCDEIWSYPMLRDLEQRQTALTGIAGHVALGVNLAVDGAPVSGDAMLVSGGYFPTLGITPAVGRLIGPQDQDPGSNLVAVLSYDFWNSRFAGDRSVVGRTLVVDGRTLTIAGVAPRGFQGTTMGTNPLVFLPLTVRRELEGFTRYDSRRTYWIYVFGRLKPGMEIARAQSELNAVYRPILAEVEAPLQEGMTDATMARFKAKQVILSPGFRGQSQVHHEAKTPLAMLFGVTIVVLLSACANIANLLLARGATRATEMGTRLALGASRRQLVGQLLTESVILALLGGVLSVGIAAATLRLLSSLLPTDAATSLQFRLQPLVLVFTGIVAIVTGILFGLFPALHNTRSDLITAIRAGAGQLTGHRHAGRFRSVLVTVQITLATTLLIAASLFLKSLVNVSHVDLGVKVDDVVTFSIAPTRSGYDSTAAGTLYAQVEDALRRRPGSTGVTASLVPLIAGSNWGTDVDVQGFPSGPGVDNNSRFNEVGAGYFTTLGIPVLAGREFTDGDTRGAPRVAVVNEKFAEKFHLGRNPIHKFMSLSGPDSLNIEIVGLVKNAKYSSVKVDVPPLFFLPWRQDGDVHALNFYVRTPLDPASQMRAIRDLLKTMAPTVPVENLRTMPEQIRENVFLDRLLSILSVVFAGLATVLAAVGLYGVLAYTVQQRTREIGVRMALGADAATVRAMVMRQIGLLIGVGGVLGIVAALGLGKLLESLLFGMTSHDPPVYVAALAVLVAVAAVSTWVPVVRASRVDPVLALRYE